MGKLGTGASFELFRFCHRHCFRSLCHQNAALQCQVCLSERHSKSLFKSSLTNFGKQLKFQKFRRPLKRALMCYFKESFTLLQLDSKPHSVQTRLRLFYAFTTYIDMVEYLKKILHQCINGLNGQQMLSFTKNSLWNGKTGPGLDKSMDGAGNPNVIQGYFQ